MSYGLLSPTKSSPADQMPLSLTVKSHRLFHGRSDPHRLTHSQIIKPSLTSTYSRRLPHSYFTLVTSLIESRLNLLFTST
ncbi:hypothetical protein TorRG33x02_023430, partial [Trema orientale]